MSLLNDLINMFSGNHQQAQQPAQPSPLQKLAQTVPPERALRGYEPAMSHIPVGQPMPQNLGGLPVGSAMTPQHIASLPANIRAQAQLYNQNPMDPRVMHMDPALFGYAADNGPTFQPRPFNGFKTGNF